MFSSRDFVDSGRMFKSLIHCEFLFCVYKIKSKFPFFFCMQMKVSQHYLLKSPILSPLYVLGIFVEE